MSEFDYYHPYCPEPSPEYNATRYVRCDNHDGCFVEECCEANTYWNDAKGACDHIPGFQKPNVGEQSKPEPKAKPEPEPAPEPAPEPVDNPPAQSPIEVEKDHHPLVGTCDVVLPTSCENPCTTMSEFDYYHPYCPEPSPEYNATRYVRCDNHDGCFVEECCEANTYWNDAKGACDYITGFQKPNVGEQSASIPYPASRPASVPSPPNCHIDDDCADDFCCSPHGWCGQGDAYCKRGPAHTSSSNCQVDEDCANGFCCSVYGWCGTGPEYCSP